jgi:poly-gamma-glutamate synthesis protein (capsule biosynthesis protein)
MTRRGKPHYPLVGLSILCAILVVSALVLWISMRPAVAPSKVTTSSVKTKTDDVHTVTFSAMGDMLAHEAVNISAKTANGYDYQQYFTDIKSLYSSSDVVFCNPETLSAGSAYGISGYPQFNAPTEFARDLMGVGCNIFNYASNHVADKGQAALKASLDNWDSLKPLAITGSNRSQQEQDTVKYFTKNGIRFAFLAFADFSNMPMPESYSVNIYHDTALVERLMKEARAHADVVLVSMHWGTEDSTVVNDDQREAAQRLANLGADIIIGTGPHVLQAVTTLPRSSGGTTLVWYSIGNVLSTQMWVNELTGGVAKWTVTKRNGTITTDNLGYDATFMSYSYTPLADGGKLVTKGTLKLQPLADASAGVAKWSTTVAERTKFVHDTLGNAVKLTITP